MDASEDGWGTELEILIQGSRQITRQQPLTSGEEQQQQHQQSQQIIFFKKQRDWKYNQHLFHVSENEINVADSLSRLEISGDYIIIPTVLSEAPKLLQIQPSIDVLANRNNRQCKRFCSLIADPCAVKQDELAIFWKKITLIHPRIPLIQKSFNKLGNEGEIAVFIHPKWIVQTWMTDLQRIVIQNVVLEPYKELLEAGGRMRKKRRHLKTGQLQISVLEGRKVMIPSRKSQKKQDQMIQVLKDHQIHDIVSVEDTARNMVNSKNSKIKLEDIQQKLNLWKTQSQN
ncbi:MAG: hypothetical protein EZS28_017206 [Streblomastix strix]|uniref:Uncharacterized protein n=1 Tax=Streblomastix strix TaxID=222440 RepID=A0A5J4VXE1_9EUKA|nr:MAG: hypothetical protein EZS28_017206 [Streblomastix strix]